MGIGQLIGYQVTTLFVGPGGDSVGRSVRLPYMLRIGCSDPGCDKPKSIKFYCQTVRCNCNLKFSLCILYSVVIVYVYMLCMNMPKQDNAL